jgi:hypothetical protein
MEVAGCEKALAYYTALLTTTVKRFKMHAPEEEEKS